MNYFGQQAKFISLLLALLLHIGIVAGSRSSVDTLLQVKDKIYLKDESGIPLTSIDLRPFPFIEDYASNITIFGSVCYAFSIEGFSDQCQKKHSNVSEEWIVATPFDFKYTNELLNEAEKYNISAVIIIFDTPIDAAGYYTNPQLISLASTDDGELIRAYAYPQRENIEGEIEHLYLTDCVLVQSIQIYYIVLTTGYLVVSFVWIVSVWTIYDDYSTTLQRALLAIPALKFMQVFIYGVYVGECPWENQIQARYMLMALVTVSTIFQTVYIALLLLMSKGWNISRNTLSRNDLSSITLLMGAVYLSYSAYYVSVNIQGMKIFISFILNLLYLVLFIVVSKNILDTRSTLQEQLSMVRTNEVRPLMVCIQLKISIMNKFLIICAIYFTWEIVVNGLIPSFSFNQTQFKPYQNVMQEIFDFFAITTILYIYRSREWPEYFGVNLLEGQMGDLDAFQEENRRIVPLLETQINEKAFQSIRSMAPASYDSSEPVMIMNPFENDYDRYNNDQESSLAETTGQYSLLSTQLPSAPHRPFTISPDIYSNLKVAFKSKPDQK